jgi:hypothetical protein
MDINYNECKNNNFSSLLCLKIFVPVVALHIATLPFRPVLLGVTDHLLGVAIIVTTDDIQQMPGQNAVLDDLWQYGASVAVR